MLGKQLKLPLNRSIWLYLSIFIGGTLRFIGLDIKLPWTEEFVAIGLSLGNSFDRLTFDAPIASTELLSLLVPNDRFAPIDAALSSAAALHQPPLYFFLLHLWLKLFPPIAGLVSIWAARSLSVICGILAILLIRNYSDRIFRSPSIANLTALIVALSPYAVYLSQEALPFSLAALLATVSIGNLILILQKHRNLNLKNSRKIATWLLANYLGLATHSLFAIVVFAQLITVFIYYLWQRQIGRKVNGQLLVNAAIGQAIGLVIATYFYLQSLDLILLDWLRNQPQKLIEVFNPIFHIIGIWITSVILLLVEVDSIPLVLGSGVFMTVFCLWATIKAVKTIRFAYSRSIYQLELGILGIYSASAMLVYPLYSWIVGIDISCGARFHFTYFPSIVLAIGLLLGILWQHSPAIGKIISGKQTVAIVILVAFVSSAIVATDYGYRKYYRTEEIVPAILSSSPYPVTIATTYQHPNHVGAILGIVWAIYHSQQHDRLDTMQFIFARQSLPACQTNCPATATIERSISQLPPPLDLWAIEFQAPIYLPEYCIADKTFIPQISGYNHRRFNCRFDRDFNESRL